MKRHLSDSMNLFFTEIKSIGIIKDFEIKTQAKKDRLVLNNLLYESKLMLNQLETAHDIWKDLKRFVKFILWLENFNNEYRLKLTDTDKIKRTFYVDSINRFFYHCMDHLYLFDLKLRIDLSTKKTSREQAVYLSLFLEEEIAKQELCEYFRSFGSNNILEVSTIGNLIEEISETKHWPKLKLGIDSRICNNIRKEEIQNIKNELSLRIAPQLIVNTIDFNYMFNFDVNLNTVHSIHNYHQNNITKNIVIHQFDIEKMDKEKLKSESNKTKIKSTELLPEIKWKQLEKYLSEFFHLPILDGEKIPINDIHEMISDLQNPKNKKLPPESITKFFQSSFNKKLFRLYLRVITDPTNQTILIPNKKQSEFMKRWDFYFVEKSSNCRTLRDFIGAKPSRKDKVETLKRYSHRYFEIQQKLISLKNDKKLYNSIQFKETIIFIDKIFELSK